MAGCISFCDFLELFSAVENVLIVLASTEMLWLLLNYPALASVVLS
jgi:hypothetical protein